MRVGRNLKSRRKRLARAGNYEQRQPFARLALKASFKAETH